jgi:transposase-like protein
MYVAQEQTRNKSMRNDDFELLLGLLEGLSAEQCERLRLALAARGEEAAVLALIERRLGDRPGCHYCPAGHEAVRRWGRSHGLQRWRCRECGRSFNALTGTALARLRKRGCWLRFAAGLAQGLTVKAAAARADVHPTTSFRWRHRFLRAGMSRREALAGIIEADETIVRLSFKGSRQWQQPGAAPPRPAKKRGCVDATLHEHVPILVARDRGGNCRSMVLPRRTSAAIEAALGEALPDDAILCTDAMAGFQALARNRGIRHEMINLNKGEWIRDRVWHTQNVNAHHSRLKRWIRNFNGVATRYLPNYLAWHHMIERQDGQTTDSIWIETAINS